MTLTIPIQTWQQLLVASVHSKFKFEAWEIGVKAVHEWLARNSPEALATPCTSGYQWKQLFLPKGTLLRTAFNGKHYHCLVEEEGLRFNGEPTSPSRFANAVGGVRRNAWRVIWVLFPDTSEWKLADTLRTKRNAPRRPASESLSARKAAQSAGPAPAAGPEQARRIHRDEWQPQRERRLAPHERRRDHAADRGATAARASGGAVNQAGGVQAVEPGAPAARFSGTGKRPVITWRAPWERSERERLARSTSAVFPAQAGIHAERAGPGPS